MKTKERKTKRKKIYGRKEAVDDIEEQNRRGEAQDKRREEGPTAQENIPFLVAVIPGRVARLPPTRGL